MADAVTSEERGTPSLSLYSLALGTFAVGTEGHMIAAILPNIASDLSVSVEAAGQLVTVFALTYAFSSPLMTTLFGHYDRRRVLLGAMVAFIISNLIAAATSNYGMLAVARVLLAVSAGLYVPNANALGSAIVPPEKRGRALAIVSGGLGVAVAIGVPLGSLAGLNFGWRIPFVGVAILSSIALIGLLTGLPGHVGKGFPAPTLAQRLKVVHQPGVLKALLQTCLLAVGAYCSYTYVAPLLFATGGISGNLLSLGLFLFGCAAFVGIVVGGHASDWLGSGKVVAIALPSLSAIFLIIFILPAVAPVASALVPAFVLFALWGFTSWAFFPAQQSRLIGITGAAVGPVILSLNASCMYLGFSIGAAFGSFVLSAVGPSYLALTSAAFLGAASLLSWSGSSSPNRRQSP